MLSSRALALLPCVVMLPCARADIILDQTPFLVKHTTSSAPKCLRIGDLHLLRGTITQSGGTVHAHCQSNSIADYALNFPPLSKYEQTPFNTTLHCDGGTIIVEGFARCMPYPDRKECSALSFNKLKPHGVGHILLAELEAS